MSRWCLTTWSRGFPYTNLGHKWHKWHKWSWSTWFAWWIFNLNVIQILIHSNVSFTKAWTSNMSFFNFEPSIPLLDLPLWHKLPWLRICSAWLPCWQIFFFLKPSLCGPGSFSATPQGQMLKHLWFGRKIYASTSHGRNIICSQKDPPQKVWTSRSPHRWIDSNWSPGRRATSARSFAPGWTAKTKPSWQSCRTCREDTVCPWFLQDVDLSRSYCTPLRFSKVDNDEVR